MWHLSYVMLGHCLIKAQFQKRWDIKQNIKETECEDLLIPFDKQSIKNSTNTISWMFYILNNFWKDTLTGNLMPVTCFKHTRTRTHTFFFCSAPLLILYSCCCFHSMYWQIAKLACLDRVNRKHPFSVCLLQPATVGVGQIEKCREATRRIVTQRAPVIFHLLV